MSDLSLVSGWGRAAASAATTARPASAAAVELLLSAARNSGSGNMLARGLGRSYGDAAQCAGGLLIDCNGLSRIRELDDDGKTVRVEAGVSIDDLIKFLVPRGYFVPVTPGTRYVSVGGAVASDVHGKNHHVDGSIGEHVTSLRLATPTGALTCSPKEQAEVYWATCGGMGLTGVITEATLQVIPIETSRLLVDTDRAPDLEACLALLSGAGKTYRYSVAWVDCMARGKHLGRSVITRGDHARRADLPARAVMSPCSYSAKQLLNVPVAPPISLLNPLTAGAFNEFWYRKAPAHRVDELQTIPHFFHPLDGVGNWNALYGPRGFTQYQFVVPYGAEHVLEVALERLSRARTPSFLAVLKAFGAADEGHLSFPMTGWTLALDIPLGLKGLPDLLDGLDILVAEAGGRVYLSKDGRLEPSVFRAMYPRVEEWRGVRDRLDPNGVLSSDLGRRLGLVDHRRQV